MASQQAAQLVEFPASRFLSNVSALADAAFADAAKCAHAGYVAGEEKALREALLIQPGHVLANINYGTLLYRREHYQAALICYTKAVEGDPTNALARFNRGNALEDVGRFAEAIQELNAALEIDPLYADVHYNLARAHARDGRNREALHHWTTYLSIDRSGDWSDMARKERKKLLRRERLQIVTRRSA
jgi:tetratricopeptide (TPR) repeat protein